MGRTKRKRNRKRSETMLSEKGDKNFDYCNLFKWYLSKGLCVNSLTPKTFENTGRGFQTTKKLYPGDIVLSVPLKAMVTLESILENNKYKQMHLTNPFLKVKDIFVLFLLLERNASQKSYFYEYIQSLPHDFTTPNYFYSSEVDKLPKFVKDEYLRQSNEINDIHANICKVDQLEIIFTIVDVKWAWNSVNSRCFFIKPSKFLNVQGTNDFALAPVLDLLNHSDNAKTKGELKKENQRYEIQTLEECEAGSEVFIKYGPHSNRYLFTEYGFFIPGNSHTAIPVKLKYFPPDICASSLQEKDLKDVEVLTDSFSWEFEILAHRLILGKEVVTKYEIDYALPYAEEEGKFNQCEISCVTAQLKQSILREMKKEILIYHNNLHNTQSQAANILKALLESELKLIQDMSKLSHTKCMM